MKTLRKIAVIGLTSTALSFAPIAVAGNGAPSGPHYNLNIIGVENPKKSDMTNSNRHTIFVPLYSKKTGVNSTDGTAIVDSKIWLTPGADFKVCDGNGFDLAYGCPDDGFDPDWNGTYVNDDGDLVEMADRKAGAVFQLPCNTNLSGYYDSNGDGKIKDDGSDNAVDLINCNQTVDTTDGTIVDIDDTDLRYVPTMHYQVWARALGKPGGSATVTTCATVQGEIECSMENTVQSRTKGKSSFTDVTNELTSLLVTYCWEYDAVDTDLCIDERITRVALFAGDTEDWFWNYDNKGLRLAQLRFYEVPQE